MVQRELGGGTSGVEQTDEDKNRKWKKERKIKRSEKNSSNDGEQTTGKRRPDSETNEKPRIGSWNVCGSATEER